MKHRKPGIANSVYYMVTVEKVKSLYFCHFKKSDMNQFCVGKPNSRQLLLILGHASSGDIASASANLLTI